MKTPLQRYEEARDEFIASGTEKARLRMERLMTPAADAALRAAEGRAAMARLDPPAPEELAPVFAPRHEEAVPASPGGRFFFMALMTLAAGLTTAGLVTHAHHSAAYYDRAREISSYTQSLERAEEVQALQQGCFTPSVPGTMTLYDAYGGTVWKKHIRVPGSWQFCSNTQDEYVFVPDR